LAYLLRADLLPRLTVGAWRDPCNAPEDASQVLLVGKACRSRNLGQGCTGITDQGLLFALAAGHLADHVNYLGLSSSKDWQRMATIRAQDYLSPTTVPIFLLFTDRNRCTPE
jgi:hypothetical protein